MALSKAGVEILFALQERKTAEEEERARKLQDEAVKWARRQAGELLRMCQKCSMDETLEILFLDKGNLDEYGMACLEALGRELGVDLSRIPIKRAIYGGNGVPDYAVAIRASEFLRLLKEASEG